MQKPSEKTKAMLLSSEEELFDKLVPADHSFRKLIKVIDWKTVVEPLRKLYSDFGRTGFDIEKGLKALLIQFWEDYSDRQMEEAVRSNMNVRWFCNFSLTEDTPDHTYFTRLRKRLGTKKLANLFNTVNDQLVSHGLFGNTFTFIDASAIITKTQLWKERDQAIKDGEEKLNNAVVSKYSKDPDAKWGAKGKKNIWFGFKRHEACDMKYGLINKVAATPANILDFQVFDKLCPNQGMVFADEGYDYQAVYERLKQNNCASGIIQQQDRKNRNRDLNSWRTKVRAPFESTFSKKNKYAKYQTLAKVQFQVIAESIVYNLKKAVRIIPTQTLSPPIC